MSSKNLSVRTLRFGPTRRVSSQCPDTGICHANCLQIAIAVSVRINYEKNSSYKRVVQ
ncbi:hypothetical protein [Wolbachia endosymbiont (group A) of Anomoia purmunda]|uniref:hypothetical protein n=1 Tax=Wolbachia endosymbiont (group A) of Anomoia purmunda TaxID=2953978 RepID=UPI00222FF4F0|nr:hypothetical protein [Wolbachia endosymbiont (group A) of Anomoia purmunda]